MNPHFILYACRPQVFARAIDSIADCLDFTIVLDNRSAFDHVCSPQEATPHKIKVRRPEVALGVSQALTLCMYIARDMGAPWFSYMHDDCQVIGDGLARLRVGAEHVFTEHPKTAMLLTKSENEVERAGNYMGPCDVLCAYNVAACLAVGGYDWLSFPDYHGDMDLYTRLNAAGYVNKQIDVTVRHMDGGGASHRISEHRMRAHSAVDEAHRKLWYEIAKERGGLT
jgi:hypothetical protein